MRPTDNTGLRIIRGIMLDGKRITWATPLQQNRLIDEIEAYLAFWDIARAGRIEIRNSVVIAR